MPAHISAHPPPFLCHDGHGHAGALVDTLGHGHVKMTIHSYTYIQQYTLCYISVKQTAAASSEHHGLVRESEDEYLGWILMK